MGIKATLETAHKALAEAGVDHALIGGIALATMGIHRATEDVDFLIHGDKKEQAKAALLQCGFQLKFETPEVIHFEGVGRLDLLLANRALSRKMVETARPIAPHQIPSVTPESLIGLKIQAYIPERSKMTFEEYLQFLEEYWQLFGPIPPEDSKVEYHTILL